MKLARDLPDNLIVMGIVDYLTVPAFVVDSNLRILHANPFFTNHKGKYAPVPTGGCVADLFDDGQRKHVTQLVHKLFNAKQDDCGPIDPLSLDLANSAVTLRLSPLRAQSGRIVGLLGLITAHDPAPLRTDEGTHWKGVIESLNHGVWDIDLESGTRYYSASWRTLRGLSENDQSRRKRVQWLNHVHPDDHTKINTIAHAVFSGEVDTFQVQYRERHSEGHWMWVRTEGKVCAWGDNGKPTRLIGTDLDITKACQTEEAYHQIATLEQRWKTAIDSAQQGLWDYDVIQGDYFHSATWRQMRGYGPDDEIPEQKDAWLACIHPDDRTVLLSKIDAVNSGKTDIVGYEYRERHKLGHWIWVLCRGKVVSRGADGQPTRLIGTDTDISSIKNQAEVLSQLSTRLELAVTVSGIGVWEYDLETKTLSWDERMREIHGISPDIADMPQGIWEASLHPDDREIAIAAAKRNLQTDIQTIEEYRILRPCGEVRYIRSRAIRHQDHTGRPKLIGINWDVTADHILANDLRNANALAEKRNNALEDARAKMEHNALHDALTGLPNRRKLDQEQQKTHGADGQTSAVLHVDLDRFKQINDTMGHAAGDAVLVEIAETLRSSAPENALVARVGGDEFVIFIPNAPNEEHLSGLAADIIQRASKPINYEGQDCRVGVSIGIATANTKCAKGKTLFVNADLALYLAKNEGRGRFRFYTEALKNAALIKRECADQILSGLDRDEFFCVYQPQFKANTLDMSGIEALVRWRHPEMGILTPDKFLTVAEELDVVSRLDQLVLDRALRDIDRWREAGLPVPRVSVNVSAKRLTDPLLPTLLAPLDAYPGQIAFELLESVFLDDPDLQLTTNLACIRDLGIEIEIDDFGTGHASIVGLLKLQPHRLKIDRQLISPVTESAQQRLLVKSIVEIGKLQGIAVVAEGVETPAHIDVLRELGCDYLQGYGLARPMPASELQALLTAAHCTGKYAEPARRKQLK